MDHWVREYLLGIWDSCRGFVVFLSLDATETKSEASGTPEKLSSTAKVPMTTLALRRLEASKGKPSVKTTETPSEKPKARQRLFYCISLNVGCLILAKLLLDFVIAPFAWWSFHLIASLIGSKSTGTDEEGPVARMFLKLIGVTFGALWALPLFLISRVVNIIWFQDISNAAVRRFVPGSGGTSGGGGGVSFSRNIADFILAVILETSFLLQAYLVVYFIPVPLVAQFFSFVHNCLYYSLYAFEYAWMSQGIELNRRLDRIETYWQYHLGFGTILAVVTLWPTSFIVSGCLFGAIFPFLIISSFASKRLNTSASEAKPEGFKLPLFGPSKYVANKLSKWFSSSGALRR